MKTKKIKTLGATLDYIMNTDTYAEDEFYDIRKQIEYNLEEAGYVTESEIECFILLERKKIHRIALDMIGYSSLDELREFIVTKGHYFSDEFFDDFYSCEGLESEQDELDELTGDIEDFINKEREGK